MFSKLCPTKTNYVDNLLYSEHMQHKKIQSCPTDVSGYVELPKNAAT